MSYCALQPADLCPTLSVLEIVRWLQACGENIKGAPIDQSNWQHSKFLADQFSQATEWLRMAANECGMSPPDGQVPTAWKSAGTAWVAMCAAGSASACINDPGHTRLTVWRSKCNKIENKVQRAEQESGGKPYIGSPRINPCPQPPKCNRCKHNVTHCHCGGRR